MTLEETEPSEDPVSVVIVFQSNEHAFVVSDGSFLYFEFKVNLQDALRKELNYFPLWVCFVWLLT